jgi:hypothetical protein
MSRRWKMVFLAVFATLIIAAGVILAIVRHTQSEAKELLEVVASLDVATSTTADVRFIEQRFHSYQVASEPSGEVHFVRFVITNRALAALKLQPLAALSATIETRDGRVVGAGIGLERQVGSGTRAALVEESLRNQHLSCNEPYCVGNPIGKPFVISRLDARATAQQKRRSFDLDVNWLTRFGGEPRICDLSPCAWEDWKTQLPNQVVDLQATYGCQ